MPQGIRERGGGLCMVIIQIAHCSFKHHLDAGGEFRALCPVALCHCSVQQSMILHSTGIQIQVVSSPVSRFGEDWCLVTKTD